MKYGILFLAACLAIMLPHCAYALASDWQRDEAVNVRLISGLDGVGQEKNIPLGLEVELAPNWHTYWRSPGAAGLPPQLDWQNSLTDNGNLAAATLLYPAPKRYSAYGLETVGYHDHFVFPIDAAVRIPGHALNLNVGVDLLVCSAICVPKSFTFALKVPEGAANEGAEAALIKAARDQLPGDAEKSGLVLKGASNDGQNLIIEVEARQPLQSPDIFIEDDKNISFGAPQITTLNNNQSVRFTIKPADTLPEGVTLADLNLTLTIVNGDHALEQHIKAPPATVSETPPSPAPVMPLALAMIFALIGGFILNLMPCVLPVLSIKILSVVGHGGGETRLVRKSFLMTAAGILFSFLILALMTILLKQCGLTLGWGVQFQQPVFLTCLILLLTLFAANMWGLFEIALPRWLGDSIINSASYHPKLAGDFVTGAFATLLATPCTAPFLGTAVGFALASGPLDILLIFFMLGLGMILPYLGIALFPGVATTLPKPGAWMVHLRNLLGLALASTAFWLTWVLSAQIPLNFAAFIGLSMVGIVLLLCLHTKTASKTLVKFGLLDFALVALGLTISGSFLPHAPASVDALWLPFNASAIEADVAEGKTVFVDVTADWCLTCKANKKFILSQDDIAQRLFHDDVLAMQADWTSPDPAVTDFLHRYGRYGIPFNAVFGPGAPKGIVLPELLTARVVNKALDVAQGKEKP